jgi:hypothetical protein
MNNKFIKKSIWTILTLFISIFGIWFLLNNQNDFLSFIKDQKETSSVISEENSDLTSKVSPQPSNTPQPIEPSTEPTPTPLSSSDSTNNSLTEPESTATPVSENQPISNSPSPDKSNMYEHFDVVLIGSEIEGLYLARAALDEGLKVKILDPRQNFGGQLLQAEMQFLDEPKDELNNSLLQGRVKELFNGFKKSTIRKQSEFKSYVDNLIKSIPIESGITIQDVISTSAQAPSKETKLAGIIYSNSSQEVKKITANYWVDNSDYAALIKRLDVTRFPGLEKLYAQKQIEYMSAGMMMKFKNVDWSLFRKTVNSLPQAERNDKFGPAYVDDHFAINFSGMSKKYKSSNDRVFLRGLNAVYQRDGEVLINALLVYTIDPSDPKSIEEAVSLGTKEMPLVLEHFRNNLPGWENAELNGIPAYPYIREYNHYEMDYMLKPSDLLSGRMFWDNVSIGGYPLDLQGIFSNKWGIEMGRPDKYGMPLRSFMLKNYENVLVAGKNVGSLAIAYGSTRIQPNTIIAAESIGIMLGQIHKENKRLKQLTQLDMTKLQLYIEKKYKIKLTGIIAKNKINGWSEEEIQKLDEGKIIYPKYIVEKNAQTVNP